MAERMRLDPPEPRATCRPSGPCTRVGAIMEVRRTPGGHRPKPRGCRSASPSMLFSMKPPPGSTHPHPSPLEMLREAAFPRASTTLRCEVPRGAGGCRAWACPGSGPASPGPGSVGPAPGPPRRPAPRPGEPGRWPPGRKPVEGPPRGPGGPQAGLPAGRLQEAEPEGHEHAPRGRGRVGPPGMPPVVEGQGLPELHPVAEEVLPPEVASALPERPVHDRRHLAPVEEVAALDGQRLQEIGEFGEPLPVSRRHQGASRCEHGLHRRCAPEDGLEDRGQVGLQGCDRHARRGPSIRPAP
jgi:hypothetical protein